MKPEVTSERLSLRRARPEDFDALLAIYGDARVHRMVASWPQDADAELIAERCKPFPVDDGIVGMVERDGEVVGSMGISRIQGAKFGLGYGFHPDHWGKGYATEMGAALIRAIFARYDAEVLKAGVWSDNPASARVLEKLGFTFTHKGYGWCKGRDAACPAELFELTRTNWLAANPLSISGDNVALRPFAFEDLPKLHAIVAQPSVAQNLAAFTCPASYEDVVNWALNRRYQGRAGFCTGVYLGSGELVGAVGISPKLDIMYFLDPDHWGNGLMTRALKAFLAWVFIEYDLEEVTADHFADNTGSGRVLSRLGFLQTGMDSGTSKARLEPAPIVLYRLSRDRFEGMNR